jgi:hypothetical protein
MTEATKDWLIEATAGWLAEATKDWFSSGHFEGAFSSSVLINALATEMPFCTQTSRRLKEPRSSSNLSFETTSNSSSVVPS